MDELAKRRERVARHLAARRADVAQARQIDIVSAMTEEECRVVLREVLRDLTRLGIVVERAAPGTMVIGTGAIDAAIELLDATHPRKGV